MCKETNVTKKDETNVDTKIKNGAHVQSALSLYSRVRELGDIREHFEAVKAQHHENSKELDSMEEMIEHESERLLDEAIALWTFEDEYECDCGCSDAPERAGFDDEQSRTKEAPASDGTDKRAAEDEDDDEDPQVRLIRLLRAFSKRDRTAAPKPPSDDESDTKDAPAPDAGKTAKRASEDEDEDPIFGPFAGPVRVVRVPARAAGSKPLGVAPLIFGALGVGCAVASLVSRWIADERKR